ncbi:MAG: ergothioneine biosynthesis protein EgtC [Scytolyngbya sp. HA4215-MV1]|jgi:glutamine amidotransferase|nr:ergothioneine biosynthesis protein EgtC [Scytolyngbya sp. HA4215-MV1]
MCRLLGYFGSPIPLDRLLYQPEHSLIVQSYQPREMTAGLLNADGFGVGWYHPIRQTEPFTYKNTVPIWSDINLPPLSRYVESSCILASIRSATPGQAVDLSNCPPFQQQFILAVHNGFIENFRQTLYRPIRDRLSDRAYQSIQGSTDSEHLFALLLTQWETSPELTLAEVLHKTLTLLSDLGQSYQTGFAANLIFSDGKQLVVSRFANRTVPSLYWLRNAPDFPDAVLVASEPLFAGDWIACPENTMLTIGEDLDIQIYPL